MRFVDLMSLQLRMVAMTEGVQSYDLSRAALDEPVRRDALPRLVGPTANRSRFVVTDTLVIDAGTICFSGSLVILPRLSLRP